MNPRLQKTVLTALAAGLQAAAFTLPAPWGMLAQGASGLLIGWAHLPQPGAVS